MKCFLLRKNKISDCRSTDRIGRLRLWNTITGSDHVILPGNREDITNGGAMRYLSRL